MVPKKKNKEKLDRNHITLLSNSPEMYKCNVCEKIFRNKKSKCYHDSCITGVRPYKCNICEQAFVKRSHFEYHERVHTGYKPFDCSLCGKAFSQKNKLNRHMLSHKQEPRFSCVKCGKHYVNRDRLLNHMSLHNGPASHACKTCGKSFRIMRNLNRHMHTHSSERPYACESCSKSFKDKSLLSRHRRTHGNERPFACAHCSRLFLSKSELSRHLAIHTDVKPFSCAYCDTVFRRKDNLDRHIRHHHADDNTNCNHTGRSEKITNKSFEENQRESSAAGDASIAVPASACSKVATIKKNKAKKSVMSPVFPSMIMSPSKQRANRRQDSLDGSSSRNDSPGNLTPIVHGSGELSNAVPVINGPIGAITLRGENKNCPRRKTFTYTEPIPLAEAVVINRRIEEKLYPQSSKSSSNYYFFTNHQKTDDVETSHLNRHSSGAPRSCNLVIGEAAIVTCNGINIATSLAKRQESLPPLHSIPSKFSDAPSDCPATRFNDTSNIVSNSSERKEDGEREKIETQQQS